MMSPSSPPEGGCSMSLRAGRPSPGRLNAPTPRSGTFTWQADSTVATSPNAPSDPEPGHLLPLSAPPDALEVTGTTLWTPRGCAYRPASGLGGRDAHAGSSAHGNREIVLDEFINRSTNIGNGQARVALKR